MVLRQRVACVFFVLLLLLMTALARGQSRDSPAVFFHGLCSDAGTWNQTKQYLIDQGLKFGGKINNLSNQTGLSADGDFFTVDLADPNISNGIENWAVQVQATLQKINQLRAQKGLPPVKFTPVGHSGGGLAIVYYTKTALYRNDVAHVITYGTPHAGTDASEFRSLADYTLGTLGAFYPPNNPCSQPKGWTESYGVVEMDISSVFLQYLNGLLFRTDIQYTSLIGQLGFGSVCPSGDCIVSAVSQDMSKLPKPPLASLFASRTSSVNHIQETPDAVNILWALNRLASVSTSLPGAPRSLTVVAGLISVSLGWTAPLTGPVSSYVIEAGKSPGASDIVVFDTFSTSTRFFQASVATGKYYLRVRARNQAGLGPPSNEVVFTIIGFSFDQD
jgi:hypothetical protein